jgi:hypothetical protein
MLNEYLFPFAYRLTVRGENGRSEETLLVRDKVRVRFRAQTSTRAPVAIRVREGFETTEWRWDSNRLIQPIPGDENSPTILTTPHLLPPQRFGFAPLVQAAFSQKVVSTQNLPVREFVFDDREQTIVRIESEVAMFTILDGRLWKETPEPFIVVEDGNVAIGSFNSIAFENIWPIDQFETMVGWHEAQGLPLYDLPEIEITDTSFLRRSNETGGATTMNEGLSYRRHFDAVLIASAAVTCLGVVTPFKLMETSIEKFAAFANLRDRVRSVVSDDAQRLLTDVATFRLREIGEDLRDDIVTFVAAWHETMTPEIISRVRRSVSRFDYASARYGTPEPKS